MSRELISASSPGRVCLAGESLDWMIKGPSIVGAIDLRVHASVQSISQAGQIIFRSAEPFKSERTINFSDLSKYNLHRLSFVQAATKVVLDAGLTPKPVEIDTFTHLPIEAGVSSSAAVSLATVTALNEYYSLGMETMKICALAYEVERTELKTGAGQMDFYACGLGKLHYLNCAAEPPDPLEQYLVPNNVRVVLVDTLTPRATTSIIAKKRVRLEQRDPLIMLYIDKTLEAVARIRNLMAEFERNVEEIGYCMTLCHNYLRDNVRSSTWLIDMCVDTCLSYGAFGAKLTGSGFGGCMFALADEKSANDIQRALSQIPVRVYITDFSHDGVRVEHFS